MKQLMIFLLLLLINSCGLPIIRDLVKKDEQTRLHNTTNPVFNSYVSSFEAAGKKNGVNVSAGNVPINFGDTENENHRGICATYQDGSKEIIIQESWWNTQSEDFKESLIYHELGHCLLGRDHDDQTVNVAGQDFKTSMMNQRIVSPIHYSPNKESYHKELFTQQSSDLITALNQ
jgi:hypothetical protein